MRYNVCPEKSWGAWGSALTTMEKAEVVANCDHLQELKCSSGLSNAFTEPVALRYWAPRQIPQPSFLIGAQSAD